MDLLYVAPCQNIPSQVDFSLLLIISATCFLSRCGTLTTISTNSSITTLSPTALALACLPQPCDTHNKSLLAELEDEDISKETCSLHFSMSLQGACNASFSLNSCDTLAKFIVDPLIVVNQ